MCYPNVPSNFTRARYKFDNVELRDSLYSAQSSISRTSRYIASVAPHATRVYSPCKATRAVLSLLRSVIVRADTISPEISGKYTPGRATGRNSPGIVYRPALGVPAQEPRVTSAREANDEQRRGDGRPARQSRRRRKRGERWRSRERFHLA